MRNVKNMRNIIYFLLLLLIVSCGTKKKAVSNEIVRAIAFIRFNVNSSRSDKAVDVTVDVTNTSVTLFSVENLPPFVVTYDGSLGISTLGKITINNLFDNSLKQCGGKKCTLAGIRASSEGLFSMDGSVMPLYMKLTDGNFQILSTTPIILETIKITKNTVRLSDFAAQYDMGLDLSDMEAGKFTAVIKIEYFLAP